MLAAAGGASNEESSNDSEIKVTDTGVARVARIVLTETVA